MALPGDLVCGWNGCRSPHGTYACEASHYSAALRYHHVHRDALREPRHTQGGYQDGKAVASFFTKNTIFNSGIASLIPKNIGEGGFYIRTVVIALILVIVCKLLLDLYLKTKHGLLLRATGANDKYTVMLGRNPGSMKIFGLALGNGFAALAGSVIAQNKGSADQQMGIGMVVLGLASVIIGLSLFRRVKFMKGTTMVILGSLVYKAAYQIVLSLGIPTDFNNLMKALIFLVALVLGGSELRKLITSLGKKPEPVKSDSKLALSNITKVFNRGTVDESKLFDNFTLDVNDGDFISVVGSNGSGKTTMLNIVCGGIQPDSGAVVFNGGEPSCSRRSTSAHGR